MAQGRWRVACVKHQNMAGSDISDNRKECVAGGGVESRRRSQRDEPVRLTVECISPEPVEVPADRPEQRLRRMT
jgi:hypothetical protein